MLISRIKKLEESIPIRDDPYDKLSDSELTEAALTLRLSIHSKIKNENEAREYKELFIDSPTLFEAMWQTQKTHPEMLTLLERQRDWEVEHFAKTQEEKDWETEQYEIAIKSYKFLRP